MSLTTGLVLFVAIMTVLLLWSVAVAVKEERREAERELAEKADRTVLVDTAAVAVEMALRAPTAELPERPKLRLKTVTDELGEWAPAAHQQVDALLFDQVAGDFFAIRRWMTEGVPA